MPKHRTPAAHVAPDRPDVATTVPVAVDWDRAAADYGAHRAVFPELTADLLVPLGIGRPGATHVDLATGVGTPGLLFAARGARVIGVDVAAGMLAVAEASAARDDLDFTALLAPAEATGLPDHLADSVTVGQAWHWFDGPAAAAEIARILVPGGRVGICAFDWTSGRGDVVDRTLDVLRAHNPEVVAARPLEAWDWRDVWARDLATAGLQEVASLQAEVVVPYARDSWRGRLRASSWVEATLSPQGVAAVDQDLAAVLADAPDVLQIPHHLRFVVAQAPS